MKNFVAQPPNLGSAAVQPFRTQRDDETLAALATVAGPVADADLGRGPRARVRPRVRGRAQACQSGRQAASPRLRGGKPGAIGAGTPRRAQVRAFARPMGVAVAKAMAFHDWKALALPFEEADDFRGAIFDLAVARAARDREPTVDLFEILLPLAGQERLCRHPEPPRVPWRSSLPTSRHGARSTRSVGSRCTEARCAIYRPSCPRPRRG